MPSYALGAIPFAPTQLYDRSGESRIAELMLRQGQNRANATAASGALWANTIANVGQTVGQGIQAYQENKREESRAAMAAKRDADWVGFVEGGEWQKDPTLLLSTATRLYGPEGAKMAQGVMSFAKIGQTGDPKLEGENFGKVILGLEGQSDQVWGRWYPHLREGAIKAGLAAPETLPEQFDPAMKGEYLSIAKQLTGNGQDKLIDHDPTHALLSPTGEVVVPAEAAAPKPDPRTLAQILRDPTSTPEQKAAATAAEKAASAAGRGPVAPKEPKWEEGLDDAGNPILYDLDTGATKPFPAGVTPKASTTESNRIASARSALDVSKGIRAYLEKDEVKKAIGPIMGRYNSLAQAAGDGDPNAVRLVAKLKSYSALQPNIHGFRAAQFAEDIESLLSTKQTPQAIIATLDGIDDAAHAVESRGRSNSAEGGGGPVKIAGQADFDKLPSGAKFIGPDGKVRTKP